MLYKIPYSFILKELYPIRPTIRKALGGYLLMHAEKLLVLLRERSSQPDYNGVFIATEPKHYLALTREFNVPETKFDIDGTTDSWIFISSQSEDFETKIYLVGTLIRSGDKRIGRFLA